MASNTKSHTSFSFLSHMILVAFVIHACLVGLGSSESTIAKLNLISEEKVMLDLYYETLCPFSAKFIVDKLSRIFDTGLTNIINLQLIPWGNVVINPNKTFDCQHGPDECTLNTIHACAIAFWPSVDKHFPFIHCVEKLVYGGNYTHWKTCFEVLALDPTPIFDCNSSGYGAKLELKYAVITTTLRPPHLYVPWVVVNGKPLYEDYDNFIHYVCKAYKGSTPSACDDINHQGT